MAPIHISAYTIVNALGRGMGASLHALREGISGLRRCDLQDVELATCIGRVDGLEHEPIAGELAAFDCRNNRLAQAALLQDGFQDAVAAARLRFGERRIGVFVGTSTSGILETERAYRSYGGERLPDGFSYRHTHDVFSVADFTCHYLGLKGPAAGVSTACSSSAKVFASASRAMRAGLCDAAVVGGVDSLCLTTLYGFDSLQLVSSQPCRPWDVARDGLSIGEAAGFALLEWPQPSAAGVALRGYGESSDAYHMSAAHPEGKGAELTIRQALDSAGVAIEQVDYINLHGTATQANDAAEDAAVFRVFGARTPCSSTKGWTGHTLGAAGVTEAVFTCLAIEHGLLPANLNLQDKDPALRANILTETRVQPVHLALTNSFGFGGTNCSLLLARLP
ncbi:MAG: beta-ketoacyl-[acyl-carrier-protein] synthase family protein [Nitrococcus sp.]|nr:beta-ketoacyl-[acyl-carrier-protein] synthase family protein [Nitrococcus sp.]